MSRNKTKKFLKTLLIFFVLLILSFLKPDYAFATISYVSQFGSTGSGNGQFDYPLGIGIDSNGFIYVGDGNNCRIQKFTSDGTFVKDWGSIGNGNGEFGFITAGIAVDSNDNIYVADSVNFRVQKFTSDGTYVTKWGSQGTGNSQFGGTDPFGPYGIALDSNDNVYVADPGNDRIQKFTSNGTFIKAIGSSGTGNGQFTYPIGVAFDSNDRLYVTDRITSGTSRVVIFTTNGTYVNHFGSSGAGDEDFTYGLIDIVIDESDNIYVQDSQQTGTTEVKVMKFDTSGNYQTKFGSSGTGNGQFLIFGGLAVDNEGNIFVADCERDIIQKFNDDEFVPRDDDNNDNSSGSSTPSVSTAWSPPACQNAKPLETPMIVSLKPSSNKVDIQFTYVLDRVTHYSLAYGYDETCSEFGVHDLGLGNTYPQGGSLLYTVNCLSPGKTYYFKIRAGNGCMPGDWSEAKKVTLWNGSATNSENSGETLAEEDQNLDKIQTRESENEIQTETPPLEEENNNSLLDQKTNDLETQKSGFVARVLNQIVEFFRRIF